MCNFLFVKIDLKKNWYQYISQGVQYHHYQKFYNNTKPHAHPYPYFLYHQEHSFNTK